MSDFRNYTENTENENNSFQIPEMPEPKKNRRKHRFGVSGDKPDPGYCYRKLF